MIRSLDRIGSIEEPKMGAFYGSVQVRTDDHEAVRKVLEALARKHKNRFYLGPNLGGWIGVYANLYGQDLGTAQDLARKLRVDVFQLSVYDDDVFAYDFYRKGKLADQYSSRPDYFGELPEETKKTMLGRPETFHDLAADEQRFVEFAARIRSQPNQPVVFASELLLLLASALRIRNVQTSYEYLAEGEDDVDGWDEFIHVPELKSERARQRQEDVVHQIAVQRLKREGLLLAEHGGQRGKETPTPHFCPAPDGAGFLVAWEQPVGLGRIEPVPVERIGPPWSEAPVPTGLMAESTVSQLALSSSGRYLAVTCSNRKFDVEVWRPDERRSVARVDRGRCAFRASFFADESAVICTSIFMVLIVVPLGPREESTIHVSSKPNLSVAHPGGERLVVSDTRSRVHVVNLTDGTVDRFLFVGGISPPGAAAGFLGDDYPHDWFKMTPEEHDELVSRRQEKSRLAHEQKIQGQPAARAEALRKEARELIEAMGKWARDALAKAREPGWVEEKALSRVWISDLAFDTSGERLFMATAGGVLVYLWRDILTASGETPPPAMSVSLEPWQRETPDGREERSSSVASLAYDAEPQRLLFAGYEGRVRYLDLATGQTGILLEPPGRPSIGQIALSRDRSVLGITCGEDHYDESPQRRGASIQFWDYGALCRRI
jgi:hypothetical protein